MIHGLTELSARDLTSVNIIHVEDEPDWQNLIRMRLKELKHSYALTTVQSPEIAMNIIKEAVDPLILIADLRLDEDRKDEYEGLTWLLDNAEDFAKDDIEMFVFSGYLYAPTRYSLKHKKIPQAHFFSKADWDEEKFIETVSQACKRLLDKHHKVNEPNIFISYSRDDNLWLKHVQTMLAPVIRHGKIKFWTDAQIKPGTHWKQEIENALASANVGLILASPTYLASDFVTDVELPALLKASQDGKLLLLWIAIYDCLFEDTSLASIRALNDPVKPIGNLPFEEQNRELARICRQIKAAIVSHFGLSE